MLRSDILYFCTTDNTQASIERLRERRCIKQRIVEDFEEYLIFINLALNSGTKLRLNWGKLTKLEQCIK